MKTFTNIIVGLAILAGGYALGCCEIYPTLDENKLPIVENKNLVIYKLHLENAALYDLLHAIYSNDDNEWWYDVVINTTQYQTVDSILNGDWEDFYCYSDTLLWDSITY